MIVLTRYALIAMAVILGPFYGLWIFGGWMMDRRGQRALALLKGPSRAPAK